MDAEKNIRAFLAIEPSAEVLAAVSRLQEKLKREISGSVSWARPQGNHLTLKFFGSIDLTDVENISAAVKRQAATMPPLHLSIEKIGVFPDLRRPRVLWVGARGDVEKLITLQKRLEDEFAAIGFPAESRPFRAHLTLGRIKDARSAAGVGEALKKHADFSAGEFQVAELILFQSQLSPQGATYTKLATFPLGI
ncbi:MAG: RNA 2',3'-cyclic phosphodiesterase [Smithellaceae bacterium]